MDIKIKNFIIENKFKIALIAVLLIAAFFRFFLLTSIPPGIHPDAATNAVDAYHAWRDNDRKVFFENNYGREGLFINIVSYFFQFFGPSYFVYKLPGAIIGILSILGMYFLAKEAARKKLAGIFASFFAAVSFWIIIFDRTGFRATLSLLAVIWTAYFFIKALRGNRWYDYALSGLFLGIGLNTYITFRLMPFVLVFGIIYKLILERKLSKLPWGKIMLLHKNFLWVIIISLLVSFPLLIYFTQNTDLLIGRSSDISVFNQPHSFTLLSLSTVSNLAMYNFFGDPNWRHNFSTEPILDPLQGLLFVLGAIIAARYLLKKQEHQKPEEITSLKANYFFMIVLFAMMFIPAGISYSPGGIPHALRAIDTAPAVFFFTALGLMAMYYKLEISLWRNKKALLLLICLIFSYLALNTFSKYFLRWGTNERTRHEFSEDFTNLSHFINEKAGAGEKILVVNQSIEVDYFTIEKPNVKKINPLNLQVVEDFSPTIIIFTNFKNDNNVDIDRLNSPEQKWKTIEGINFGKGSHLIKILEKI